MVRMPIIISVGGLQYWKQETQEVKDSLGYIKASLGYMRPTPHPNICVYIFNCFPVNELNASLKVHK